MSSAADIVRVLWPNGNGPDKPQVHAVLDGARNDALVPQLILSGLPQQCLYAGALSPKLCQAAPWLVHLAPESRLTVTLLSSGWGRAWGIYVVAPPDVTTQSLRRHFRSLLRVQSEDGRRLAFRYYDPRVLRAYFPTCRPAEMCRILGPADRLVAESPEGRTLVFEPVAPVSAAERARLTDMHVLTIRNAQMTALHKTLANDSEAAFVQQLCERLRMRHASALAGLDDDSLRRVVEAGCARAARLGLAARADRAAFVALMFDVTPDLDTHSAVRAVLQDGSMSPAIRLQLLPRLVPLHVWRAITRPLEAAALLQWLDSHAGEALP